MARGAGEGSIFRRSRPGDAEGRPTGRWVAQVDLGFVDVGGGRRARRYRTVSGVTKREVTEALNRMLHERTVGTLADAPKITVEEFLRHWIASKRNLRPSTVRAYRTWIEQHIIPSIGHLRLAKLRAADVDAMLTVKVAGGLSPRSAHHIRAVLRAALRKAQRDNLVTRNAAGESDPVSVKDVEMAYFGADDARAFLAAIRGTRLEALYTVAVALGLRQGEALGLAWEDVDLDGRRLRVRRALQRIDGRLQLTEVKTKGSNRTVDLPTFAVDALRAHRLRQLEERILAGSRWVETGLVFTTSVGTGLDGPKITRGFQAFCAQAGLPRIRFHDLRHTAATLLLVQGVPMRVVQELLGHSSMRVTADRYSHVLDSLKRDAADAMDRFAAGPSRQSS